MKKQEFPQINVKSKKKKTSSSFKINDKNIERKNSCTANSKEFLSFNRDLRRVQKNPKLIKF